MSSVVNPSNTLVTHSTAVDRTGAVGVTVITDTNLYSGNWYAVQVLADATFTTFNETGAQGGVMTGMVIGAGTTLFGQITDMQLLSGKVRAYRG